MKLLRLFVISIGGAWWGRGVIELSVWYLAWSVVCLFVWCALWLDQLHTNQKPGKNNAIDQYTKANSWPENEEWR